MYPGLEIPSASGVERRVLLPLKKCRLQGVYVNLLFANCQEQVRGSLIAQLNISTWHLKAALESSSACANTSAELDSIIHASSIQEFQQLPLFDALALQALR